jgi:hypothetical protein
MQQDVGTRCRATRKVQLFRCDVNRRGGERERFLKLRGTFLTKRREDGEAIENRSGGRAASKIRDSDPDIGQHT